MSIPTDVASIAATLREQADVRTVFGEPIVAEGRTVVPVARVAYGFGGGYGEGGVVDGTVVPDDPDRLPAERGDGGGLGGGLVATPVGVVELTPQGTRFVRVGGRRRLVTALGLGALAGFLAGRQWVASRRD